MVVFLLGLFAYAFQVLFPQYAVGPIGWGQRLFGIAAGFAFRSWMKHALSELFLEPVQSHVRPNALVQSLSETSINLHSRWWESEPWRAISIILLIAMGAILLPRASGFLGSITRLKVGDLEVEMAQFQQNLQTGNSLRLHRTQQSNSLIFLTVLEDDEKIKKRIASDLRSIKLLAGEANLEKQKVGAQAYLAFSESLLSPAARCSRTLFESGMSAENLREFVRNLTWDYKLLLEEVSSTEAPTTVNIEARIAQLKQTIRSGMRELRCDPELIKATDRNLGLTPNEARSLSNLPRSYITLSMLHYIGEDRLEAIRVLERQQKNFPQDISLMILLAQLWNEEEIGSDKSVDYFTIAYETTVTLRKFIDEQKCDSLPKSIDLVDSCDVEKACSKSGKLILGKFDREIRRCSKCCENGKWDEISCPTESSCKADIDRWNKNIPRLQNSLAYSLLLSDRDKHRLQINKVVGLASEAVRTEYKMLTGSSVPSIPSAAEPILGELNAGYVWGAVDTYALGLLASKRFDAGLYDEYAQCAAPLLDASKEWVLKQMEAIAPDCPEYQKDSKKVCIKIRSSTYISLDNTYLLAVDHQAIARELLAGHSGSGCPLSRAWATLLKDK
jgi:hypothetical protein